MVADMTAGMTAATLRVGETAVAASLGTVAEGTLSLAEKLPGRGCLASAVRASGTFLAKDARSQSGDFNAEDSARKAEGSTGSIQDSMRRACLSLKLTSKGGAVDSTNFRNQRMKPTWHVLQVPRPPPPPPLAAVPAEPREFKGGAG